jgi:hypothetical protein
VLYQPARCECRMAWPCLGVEHLSVTVTSSLPRGQHAKSCPEDAEYANPYIHLSLAARGQASNVPFQENLDGGRDVICYYDRNSSLIRCETDISDDAPRGLLLTFK